MLARIHDRPRVQEARVTLNLNSLNLKPSNPSHGMEDSEHESGFN